MKPLIFALSLLCLSAASVAQGHAHQHGVVRLDVAIDGQALTLSLDAPLDSLLGFEHRPRTAAEKAGMAALLKQLDPGAALWRPNAQAQCSLIKTTLESALLQAPAPSAAEAGEHADLDGSWEFRCAQVDQLSSIELGLFDAFKRIQRIEVQVAGPKGQLKRELKRPEKMLGLSR
jgi:Protein of unknown function (DUF2796)